MYTHNISSALDHFCKAATFVKLPFMRARRGRYHRTSSNACSIRGCAKWPKYSNNPSRACGTLDQDWTKLQTCVMPPLTLLCRPAFSIWFFKKHRGI